jgi:glycosyltransferase involved in cell wall biosynthesis
MRHFLSRVGCIALLGLSFAQPLLGKGLRVDLTVVGLVWGVDGEGRQAIDLMKILQKSTSMSFLRIGHLSEEDLGAVSSKVRKALLRSGAKHPGRVLIHEYMLTCPPRNEIPKEGYWSRFGVPQKTKRQVRFAYTMFESTQVPMEWVHILNTSFDGAIVPDEFLVQVYRDSGVKIPIFVIPLGRDFSRFLKAPLKKTRGTPFVFANFSACSARKNLLKLVQAFGDAFGSTPDVRLRLGWRWVDGDLPRSILAEIAARGLENVTIDRHAFNADAYFDRFQQVDCYVNIATGEGFSIQPREAMALGIPVIVTNNTGQKTICESGLVRVVPSPYAIQAFYPFPGDFGEQYQCRTSDVVDALRDVYTKYETYLQKSADARKWASQYHFTKMTPLYRSLIKPVRVVLGKKNEILADGTVVTTSKKLIRKYRSALKKPKTQV